MAYWMVYERCNDCDVPNCLQCQRAERRMTLRVIEADEMPEATLNGPCATSEELLKIIGQYFDFDRETGFMYFKVEP